MTLQGPIYISSAFLAYAALHSALATHIVKTWVRDRFGTVGERYYRLFYNVMGGLTLLPILWLLAVFPGDVIYRLPNPWLFLALSLQLSGALIILIGLQQTGLRSFLGLGWLLGSVDDVGNELITTGLYRMMRHPLYTGGLLILWFTPVLTTSLLAFNIVATLYLYIGSIFEERRMLTVFGDQYAVYQSEVPRFIPRPGTNPQV